MTPRTFWITVAVIALLFLCALAFIFWHGHGSESPTATSTPTFPISGGTTGEAGGTSTDSGLMTVTARGGSSSVTTKDFVNNGTTIPDPSNKGMYYLAGGPGYCNPDGSCPSAAPADDFIVTYDSAQQAFNIALTKEPLGQSRKDAEQFMLTTLGVSQNDLCSLNYYIGTDFYTNEQYAGVNLGFSFCPDATPLPN